MITFFHKNKIKTIVLFAFCIPAVTSAAVLSLSPASGAYEQGKTFVVSVVVDGADAEVNGAESEIVFDSGAFSVQNISKDGSVFGLWAEEPKFSNAAGTISFVGGSTAAFTGKKTILSVTFKAVKEGEGTVAFSPAPTSKVVAADGKGTDVLTDTKSATYTIGKAIKAPLPPELTVELPAIPIVASLAHPDPEKWYKENIVKFAWDVPATVDSIKTLFDESSRSAPTVSHNPPTVEEEIKDIADGVHYFHIAFRNVSGSGTAAHRKVMIDKTPPLKFEVAQKEDSTGIGGIILQFNATDTTSGIDRYEIAVDGGKPILVALKDLTANGYELSAQDPGEHTAKISAFDKAGNTTDAEIKFTVAGVPEPPVKKAADEAPVSAGVGTMYWITLGILLALCVFFGSRMYSERRRYMNDRELLKRETDEVGEKLGKVFGVLRDETEEQVHALSNKPNLSDTEREILEKLKDALDMSEEILDKEVEDLRKFLR